MTSTPGLGKLELAVLTAVARLGDEAYGLGPPRRQRPAEAAATIRTATTS